MNNSHKMGRRAACAAVFGIGGSLLLANRSLGDLKRKKSKVKPALCFQNADFYNSQGKFNEQAAKGAYLTLMKWFGYPIPDSLRENIRVTDFGLGRFTEVGVGALRWVNDKKWNYASTDAFLLPNQMVPEHWHIALESEGVTAKMESYHVRYGSAFIYGEGKPTANLSVKIHESEAKYVTVMNETPLQVGEVTGRKKPLEKHWLQAGAEGCILTEPSTYHTSAATRFTNPSIFT